MEVNGIEYGYNIMPQYGKVNAEIYRVYPYSDNLHIHLISKEFGSLFRSPNENDYLKAKKWVDLQMSSILLANTD